MTITNGYCTLTEFKAFAIPDADTDAPDDGVIEAIIESASRFIDGRTCRTFYKSSADETRYFTACEPDELETGDLVSITTLATDDLGDRTYSSAWTTAYYDLFPYNAALIGMPYTRLEVTPDSLYYFPTWKKGVKIVGKFGFPSVPDDVNQACLLIASSVYRHRQGENTSGVATITAAGVVITPHDIPADAVYMLQRYMKLT